jgi:hypothetical protein
MGDIFGQLMPKITKETGHATRESGEEITWKDVDYDKLKSLRESNPQINSWDMREGEAAGWRSDNNRIPVNDSKGGVGMQIHPTTSEVRQSLRTDVTPQTNYYIDPYTGFSEAFMANQSTPLPSSQGSVSPVSQARDSQEDNVTEYMGRPLSDDDDNNPRVGQIT